MVDYLNGKIYKITNNVTDDIYIGSTIKTLKERFSNHKRNYKQFLNGNYGNVRVFKLFGKFGIENCAIELIELYPCESKNELEQQESVYINNNKAFCVNNNIPGRTNKQYIIDNKDKIKQYRIDNKDKIKQYQNKYDIDNKDKIKKQKKKLINCGCGSKFTNGNKNRHLKSKKHKQYLEHQTINNNNNCNITINNYN